MNYYLRKKYEWLQYQFYYFISLVTGKRFKLTGCDFDSGSDYLELENVTVLKNMWGIFKVPDKYKKEFTTNIGNLGWCFTTPLRKYGVIGYPMVRFLDKPKKIKYFKYFDVSYDLDLTIEKYRKFNTSFDLWCSTEDTFSFDTVTHEIMVWDNYFASSPHGDYKGTVDINGSKYRLYHGFMDKSEEESLNTKGWKYTAFLKLDKVNKNDLDFTEFFNVMVSKKLISQEEYVLRAEFGNEIYNASGKTIINDFNYNIV